MLKNAKNSAPHNLLANQISALVHYALGQARTTGWLAGVGPRTLTEECMRFTDMMQKHFPIDPPGNRDRRRNPHPIPCNCLLRWTSAF